MVTKGRSVSIRGKTVTLRPLLTTNAEAARELFALPAGYTVTEVSNALGMNYSQAHSIRKKMGESEGLPDPIKGALNSHVEPKKLPSGQYHKGPQRGQRLTEDEAATWDAPVRRESAKARATGTKTAARAIERETANERAGRPAGTGLKTSSRVGKLRTGNLPRDIQAGECANCGHDLVVRPTPQGFVFVHVNTTQEEYFAVTQFCQAVPAKLVK
jgi:hypothetical protein